jgi:hypothetical protein
MVKICISHFIQIVHGIEGQMAVCGLDRSINCHMDKITMNYLLYYTKPNKTTSIRTQLDALYGHS